MPMFLSIIIYDKIFLAVYVFVSLLSYQKEGV